MSKRIFCCCISLVSSVFVQADVPQDPVESAAWKKRVMENILRDSKIPPNEAIPKLGERLYSLSRPWNKSNDSIDVFNYAQEQMLAIPGHATYYQEKIEEMRANVFADAKKTEDEILKMQDEGKEPTDEKSFERYYVDCMRTLAFMPSPETVSVLGFYLNDPSGSDGKTLLGNPKTKPGDDFEPTPSNANLAALAIRNLGIEKMPFKASEQSLKGRWAVDEEVTAGKDWWNEVKAGKRTYRFIGSEIEYGPDGPATPEQLQKIERNRRRDEAHTAGTRRPGIAEADNFEAAPKAKSIGSLVAKLGSALLLAGAALYFFRKKLKSLGSD